MNRGNHDVPMMSPDRCLSMAVFLWGWPVLLKVGFVCHLHAGAPFAICAKGWAALC